MFRVAQHFLRQIGLLVPTFTVLNTPLTKANAWDHEQTWNTMVPLVSWARGPVQAGYGYNEVPVTILSATCALLASLT